MVETLRIERLGRRGDGIAETPMGSVYIAYALPGETVEVERRGERADLVSVIAPAIERIAPFCPVYGRCGGCAAQHIAPALYGAWKRAAVTEALAAARIDAPVGDLVDAHGEGRRRLTLHTRVAPEGVTVGFMARQSHDIVPIETCPIAVPALASAPVIAAAFAKILAQGKKPLDLQFTATEAGIDVDLRGHGAVSPRERQSLITRAEAADLTRLSLHGELLIERRAPSLTIGRAKVVAPSGGFLQATTAGEQALAERVVAACTGARRVADLFSGIGPFALRLAEAAAVHAVESDKAALAALDRAARAVPGLRPITTEARDLFRRPLFPSELQDFDAVVIDPPRAGAEAQARQLAQSRVPLVVSVSCDTGTFSRDARILIDGGYRLESVAPIDQFKYSPHVELVGIFRKASAKAGRARSLR